MLKLLLEGWEAKAKELGALQRDREAQSPEELLWLIALYASEGKPFAGASALVRLRDDCRLSKTEERRRMAQVDMRKRLPV